MTYWSLGINDKALEYLQNYVSLLNAENPKAQAIGYNNLGAVYKEIGNPERAMEFYRKAFHYYLLAGDSLDLPSPLTNIGTIYSSKDILDSALYYYKNSLDISELMNDKLQSAKTRHNIALIQGRQGDFDSASALLHQYLQTCSELGYKEGIAQALFSLGNLEENRHDLTRATDWFNQCILVADSIGLSNILMQAHRNLSEILQEKNMEKEAFHHFKKYTEIKDTLLNKEKARIITELETRYETEKKEQENVLLVKDNELKNRTINALYLIIAGIILLTAAIVYIIIVSRRNAMNKRQLAESEATRLADKVEFQNRELASSALAMSRNLSFIKNLLTELKKLSPHVDPDGLNSIRSISRSIQHLDNDPAWEEFEMRFHQVHIKFYENLGRQYPSLTTNEIRLCALLKLGMNTKEISSVTFQNIRAIEAARLRLRKKFGLEGNTDLGAYLQKF
jgi:tetratricopeptide (TPR) repeat protein